MSPKILDEFTDLPVSRQRKHQLRNPEWRKEQLKKAHQSPKYKAYMKQYYMKHREHYNECNKQWRIKKLLENDQRLF